MNKKIYTIFFVLLSLLCFFSCKKDINDEQAINDTPDLLAKTFSSVSGFVTDENNAAVAGASVKVGTAAASVLTDEYGYFKVKDVEVNKIAATVTVSKPGYFKGFKTWAVTANKVAFFRIKLIPKTIAGTISASSGGNVSLSNGLIIALPSNGVVKASGNTAYTGNINVAVSWLDPEANDLTEIMPGDLRGIDDAGAIKGLTTFGMAAVELTNDAGELLQIAAGKKATITMPLSSLLNAAAPSTIPLWYFDESIGLWKEDGSAAKAGNSFVGEVSHFSYWNCDLPNATVPLSFTVVNAGGNPVANARIEIVPTTPGSWSHIGGFTDETGYVSVFVTPDNSYSLQLYSTCNPWGGIPDYSTTFSVAHTAVDLGNIAVAPTINANVTGSITDCDGQPVTNGRIFVHNGNSYTCYNTDNTGAYNFNMILCHGTTNVDLIAEDVSASQQSTVMPYTLVAGNNTIGNMVACGGPAEFVHFSIDGGLSFHDFISPPDDFLLYSYGSSTTLYFSATSSTGPGPATSFEMSFIYTGIGVGTVQNLLYISGSAIPEPITMTTPIGINITEYDPVSGYIAGNFTGVVTGTAPPNTTYPIVCSFRAKRFG